MNLTKYIEDMKNAFNQREMRYGERAYLHEAYQILMKMEQEQGLEKRIEKEAGGVGLILNYHFENLKHNEQPDTNARCKVFLEEMRLLKSPKCYDYYVRRYEDILKSKI